MKNVVCLVLGGGKGTRLLPLTGERSKPAVPLAGKYRLIDIPISNCINSGIRRIYLLTQFNSGLKIQPAIISNGREDGWIMPTHLATQGFYILRARSNLIEVRDVLDR